MVVHQVFLLSSLPNNLTDDAHRRHRRVVNAAFGPNEAKRFVPHATDAATKAREFRWYSFLSSKADTSSCCQMVDKWNDIIGNSESGSSIVIDASGWLGKATLDACVLASALGVRRLRTDLISHLTSFGVGAFGYDFGALDEKDNQLTKSYMNVMYDHLRLASAVQGSPHVNHLSRHIAMRPLGSPPDCSFS